MQETHHGGRLVGVAGRVALLVSDVEATWRARRGLGDAGDVHGLAVAPRRVQGPRDQQAGLHGENGRQAARRTEGQYTARTLRNACGAEDTGTHAVGDNGVQQTGRGAVRRRRLRLLSAPASPAWRWRYLKPCCRSPASSPCDRESQALQPRIELRYRYSRYPSARCC